MTAIYDAITPDLLLLKTLASLTLTGSLQKICLGHALYTSILMGAVAVSLRFKALSSTASVYIDVNVAYHHKNTYFAFSVNHYRLGNKSARREFHSKAICQINLKEKILEYIHNIGLELNPSLHLALQKY